MLRLASAQSSACLPPALRHPPPARVHRATLRAKGRVGVVYEYDVDVVVVGGTLDMTVITLNARSSRRTKKKLKLTENKSFQYGNTRQQRGNGEDKVKDQRVMG